MTRTPTSKPQQELERINRQLADLLAHDPVSLRFGAGTAMSDELILCGILGGKDVGKSTLINALAQCEVSALAPEVSEGTRRPIAFVHADARLALESRLEAVGCGDQLEVTEHHADAMRRAVLIDLPDFDSDFQHHVETVRAITPALDRILWVLTPRKIGDRAWVEMFANVIKDNDNVLYVLNKTDELLADEHINGLSNNERGDRDGQAAEDCWRSQHDWVAKSLSTSGCEAKPEQRFLVAARYATEDAFVNRVAWLWNDMDWSKYSSQRGAIEQFAQRASDDLHRLRQRVLSPIDEAQTTRIKEANRNIECRVFAQRISKHYELDDLVGRLNDACDPAYLQRAVGIVFDEKYVSELTESLKTTQRSDAELADQWLETRADQWPLLRLMHWPLGWISRAIGRRAAGSIRLINPDQAQPTRSLEALEVDGFSLADRVDSLRARLLADHDIAARRANLDKKIPSAESLTARLKHAYQRVVPQMEETWLAQARHLDRKPSIFGRGMLWLILFWFPLIQPIGGGLLEMYVESGTVSWTQGLYRIVTALSAPHLLASLACVATIYAVILAGMYARRLRRLRKLRESNDVLGSIEEALVDTIIESVVAPLAKPFQDRLDELSLICERLQRLTK